jgi:hypothetical protein
VKAKKSQQGFWDWLLTPLRPFKLNRSQLEFPPKGNMAMDDNGSDPGRENQNAGQAHQAGVNPANDASGTHFHSVQEPTANISRDLEPSGNQPENVGQENTAGLPRSGEQAAFTPAALSPNDLGYQVTGSPSPIPLGIESGIPQSEKTSQNGANAPSSQISKESSVELNQISRSFNELVSRMPDLLAEAQMHLRQGTLPLFGCGYEKPKVLTTANSRLTEIDTTSNWVFVGDLHGDYYAWWLIEQWLAKAPEKKVCFLGDLVDRGPYSGEMFAAILDFAFKNPGRLLWIVGNHDIAIRRQNNTGLFTSLVEPAEFLDWLNAPQELTQAERDSRQQWGQLFISVAKRLPRVVLFGDGSLVTHGGIPLKDLWQDNCLQNTEALHSEQHLSDFTFNRATNAPFKTGWKTPSRRAINHGLEFGYQDLAEFAEKVSAFFSFQRLIRGHDHVDNGYEIPSKYEKVQLLTINGFGFDHLQNSLTKYRDKIYVAQGRQGQLPEITALDVNPKEREAFYQPWIDANSQPKKSEH